MRMSKGRLMFIILSAFWVDHLPLKRISEVLELERTLRVQWKRLKSRALMN